MFCSKCGAKNNDDAQFCTSCGAPLMMVPAENTQTLESSFASMKGEDLIQKVGQFNDLLKQAALAEVNQLIEYFGPMSDHYTSYINAENRLENMKPISRLWLLGGIFLTIFGGVFSLDSGGSKTPFIMLLIGIALIVLYFRGRNKDKITESETKDTIIREITILRNHYDGYTVKKYQFDIENEQLFCMNPKILEMIKDTIESDQAKSVQEAFQKIMNDVRLSQAQLTAMEAYQMAGQAQQDAAVANAAAGAATVINFLK